MWSDEVTAVTGYPMSGGHFFPEQNAGGAIAERRSFFRLGGSRESRLEQSSSDRRKLLIDKRLSGNLLAALLSF